MAGRERKERASGDEGAIGAHLEALVKRAGLTDAEFAAAIGKDKDTVILYYGGHRLPKLKDFRRIAQVLGLDNVFDALPDLPVLRKSRRRKA